MSTPESAKLDAATKAAEAVDARKEPGAGRRPTEEEAAAAERAAPADPDVAGTYKDQVERGAEQEGEGAIDVANDGRRPLADS